MENQLIKFKTISMKKIFTFLISMMALSSVFAQSGSYHRNNSGNNGYDNNSSSWNNGYDRNHNNSSYYDQGNSGYSDSHQDRYNDSRYGRSGNNGYSDRDRDYDRHNTYDSHYGYNRSGSRYSQRDV